MSEIEEERILEEVRAHKIGLAGSYHIDVHIGIKRIAMHLAPEEELEQLLVPRRAAWRAISGSSLGGDVYSARPWRPTREDRRWCGWRWWAGHVEEWHEGPASFVVWRVGVISTFPLVMAL